MECKISLSRFLFLRHSHNGLIHKLQEQFNISSSRLLFLRHSIQKPQNQFMKTPAWIWSWIEDILQRKFNRAATLKMTMPGWENWGVSSSGLSLGFGVQGSGFGVQGRFGVRFRVQRWLGVWNALKHACASKFGVSAHSAAPPVTGFQVQGSGFKVQRSGFRFRVGLGFGLRFSVGLGFEML